MNAELIIPAFILNNACFEISILKPDIQSGIYALMTECFLIKSGSMSMLSPGPVGTGTTQVSSPDSYRDWERAGGEVRFREV